ncbi:unnamed protein product [Sphenostylis stenocarpa]|uniref:Uncharacterized protein n=1 Tax=Sphenostylis stenocarpa TaxID=92480 RepID=A0AA86VGD2_9FABA|nr:unnamed protein product [Sphenostylis stenocarpa]
MNIAKKTYYTLTQSRYKPRSRRENQNPYILPSNTTFLHRHKSFIRGEKKSHEKGERTKEKEKIGLKDREKGNA